jgi:hypothetical protein
MKQPLKYRELGYIGKLITKKGIEYFVLGFAGNTTKNNAKNINLIGYCVTKEKSKSTETILFEETESVICYDEFKDCLTLNTDLLTE